MAIWHCTFVDPRPAMQPLRRRVTDRSAFEPLVSTSVSV
jgi:hypothetical protein